MRTVNILQKLLLGYMRNFPIDLGKDKFMGYINFDEIPSPCIYKSSDAVRYELYLNEYISRNIFMFDRYERNTINHLLHFVKTDMTFFDIGANMGAYSLVLSKYLSYGRIFALEPLSINYERLLKNIKLSGVSNIFPSKLAISDKKGMAKIYYSLGPTGLSSASMSKKENLTAQAVQKEETIGVTDLDSYCIENNIDKIDILKIDIEGAEPFALRGASRIVENSPNLILVIELNDSHLKRIGSSSRELFSQIKNMGFVSYLPSAWPFRLKKINECPADNCMNNLICIKNI